MKLSIRPGTPQDADACALVCFEAFQETACAHDFPPEFPSVGVTTMVLQRLLTDPRHLSVVALEGDRIVGSNFLDVRARIGGIGPLSVHPSVQSRGVGRRLMEAVLKHSESRALEGIRLVQSAYNDYSFALYSKLGFATKATFVVLQGQLSRHDFASGISVRTATLNDLEACNSLSQFAIGFERGHELCAAIEIGTARVAEQRSRVVAYTCEVAYYAHSVAESNEGLKALISEARGFGGLGFMVPGHNSELLGWCFERGLRVVQIMTLMAIGACEEPAGAYLPSILF